MVFKPVATIGARDDAEPIEIRVLKKWIPHNQNTDLCYLFVDEKGDAIHVTCLLTNEPYFDNLISVGNCYIVDRYIPMPKQSNMPACAHEASLYIGRKTTFERAQNEKIPRYYYRFATYDDLRERSASRMLTDYIGLVEDRGMKPTTKGLRLRKVLVKDESGNVLEMTFWPKQQHLLPQTMTRGDIWAITGVLITTYLTTLQIESTPATTIDINPHKPETAPHVNRLRHMPPGALAPRREITPLAAIKNKTTKDLAIQNRFTCLASLADIRERRPWFYVICASCGQKMLKRDGTRATYECPDDDGEAKFQYCVNAKIKDTSEELDVVFFNESMTQMLGISCHDMITTHAEDNAYQLPKKFSEIDKAPKFMSITMKEVDRTVAVNSIDADDGSHIVAPSIEEPPTSTSSAPVTPAKRHWRADKGKPVCHIIHNLLSI